MKCPGSRGGCGSGSRSSAPSCTIRGWCSWTNRSPGWTTPLRRSWPTGCAASPRPVQSSSWRRTTWISPTGSSVAWLSYAAGGSSRTNPPGSTSGHATARWSVTEMFLKVAVLVLKKDLAIEAKSREILYTTVFFAISCLLIFSVAFVKEGVPAEDAASGILWIALAFSGTIALGRAFERERYGETLRALLMAPASRPAIYVGKLLGMILSMLSTQVVLLPLVAFLFRAPLFARPLLLAALLGLGTLGFASVGTLFAAMLVRTR